MYGSIVRSYLERERTYFNLITAKLTSIKDVGARLIPTVDSVSCIQREVNFTITKIGGSCKSKEVRSLAADTVRESVASFSEASSCTPMIQLLYL